MSYVGRNARGSLVVAKSRVRFGSVVEAFWAGETPETICQAYLWLNLEQVLARLPIIWPTGRPWMPNWRARIARPRASVWRHGRGTPTSGPGLPAHKPPAVA